MRYREYKDFNDGLNSKIKLINNSLYKSLCKEIEFKNYLQGVWDTGTGLVFKFRSDTNGLNEELGRHRGKSDDRQCKLCEEECESVVQCSGSVLRMILFEILRQSVGWKF